MITPSCPISAWTQCGPFWPLCTGFYVCSCSTEFLGSLGKICRNEFSYGPVRNGSVHFREKLMEMSDKSKNKSRIVCTTAA